MKFRQFKIEDRNINNPNEIKRILLANNMSWLHDSEIEEAEVEIKNNTLIWHRGNYIVGQWYYGIWKNGNFSGTWENGIWENGNFNGKWKSGIRK